MRAATWCANRGPRRAGACHCIRADPRQTRSDHRSNVSILRRSLRGHGRLVQQVRPVPDLSVGRFRHPCCSWSGFGSNADDPRAVAVREGNHRRVFGRRSRDRWRYRHQVFGSRLRQCCQRTGHDLTDWNCCFQVGGGFRVGKHRRTDILSGICLRFRRSCRPGPVGRRPRRFQGADREPGGGANPGSDRDANHRADRHPDGTHTNAGPGIAGG